MYGCMSVTKFCKWKIQYISSHSSLNNEVGDGFVLARRALLVMYVLRGYVIQLGIFYMHCILVGDIIPWPHGKIMQLVTE